MKYMFDPVFLVEGMETGLIKVLPQPSLPARW
jgi:hypothetical protein